MKKPFSYFLVERENLLIVAEVLKVKLAIPAIQTITPAKARFVFMFLWELERHARKYNVSYCLLDNRTNKPCFFTSNIAVLVGYDSSILPDSWASYFMQMIRDKEMIADIEHALQLLKKNVLEDEIGATAIVVCGVGAVNLKGMPLRFCYANRCIYQKGDPEPLIMFDRISNIHHLLKEEGYWIRIVTPSCVYSWFSVESKVRKKDILTAEETTIVQGLARGQALQETATLLKITLETAERHVRNACNRLLAKDTDALVYLSWLAGVLAEI